MDHAKSYINILDNGRHHTHTSQLPNFHKDNLSHLGKHQWNMASFASGCAAPYLKHHTVPMCQVTWNALPTSSFSKRQVDDIFGSKEMWPFHLSTVATALKNQEHGIHQQERTCEVAMKKVMTRSLGCSKKTTNVVTSHNTWSWTSIPNCSFVRKTPEDILKCIPTKSWMVTSYTTAIMLLILLLQVKWTTSG